MFRSLQILSLKMRGYRSDTKIGECFFNGVYVEKNTDIAKEYADKAIKKGEVEGFQLLAKLIADTDKAKSAFLMGRYWEGSKSNEQAIQQYTDALKLNYERAKKEIRRIVDDYADEKRILFYKKLISEHSEFFPDILAIYLNPKYKVVDQELKDEVTQGVIDANIQDFINQLKALLAEKEAIVMGVLGALSGKYAQAAKILADLYVTKAHQEKEKSQKYFKNALTFYEKAVNLRDAEAVLYLSGLKFNGEGKEFLEPNEKIFDYYLLSAKRKNQVILETLQQKAELLTDTQLFQLGKIHRDVYKLPTKALEYFKKLADKKFSSAISEIERMANHDNSHAMDLARLYGDDEDNKNMLKYYFIAAKKLYFQAIDNLEKLIDKLSDPEIFELADVCSKIINKHRSAVSYFKSLADKNHPSALIRLNKLIENNRELAYFLAESYQKDDEAGKLKSYEYYLISANLNYPPALNDLIKFGESHDVLAQYTLFKYYFQGKNKIEALKWCLLAKDQGHPEVDHFLTTQVFTVEEYLMIARHFEDKSENDDAWIVFAIYFYEKAFHLKNGSAALYLGLFLLVEHAEFGISKNQEMAFEFLLKAHEYNHSDALVHLKCNAVLPGQLSKVGELFSKQQDEYHASQFFQQAKRTSFTTNLSYESKTLLSVYNLFTTKNSKQTVENNKKTEPKL